jgi:threonine dehydrogenase-like Zn-dependent dehydrogenase
MYQQVDYERAIQLLADGKLTLEPLVTHHFPFERYEDAYRTIEEAKGNVMKVMITLD